MKRSHFEAYTHGLEYFERCPSIEINMLECPYKIGSPERDLWIEGWTHARNSELGEPDDE